MTVSFNEFGPWANQQERLFEFVEGKPVLLPNSSQLRSLLISYLLASLKNFVEGTNLRMRNRPRITFSTIAEVRYPDIVVDAGTFNADRKEPSLPVLFIDVGRERDWSALLDARYVTISAIASPSEVSRFLTKSCRLCALDPAGRPRSAGDRDPPFPCNRDLIP